MTTITRYHGRTSLAISLIAALLLAMPVHGARADSNSNPSILPINSTPAGMTYGQWSAAWWQYVFSVPAPQNPLFDQSGANCSAGQPFVARHVFFLVGFIAFQLPGGPPVPPTATVVRNCTIPAGTMLFFPVANGEQDNLNPGKPDLTNTVDQLTQLAIDGMSPKIVGTLSASIDGVPVNNVAGYQVQSPVFSYSLPDNNIVTALTEINVPARTVYPAVGDGYYLMVGPLSAGPHKIHFGASGFGLDVTYNLMVQ